MWASKATSKSLFWKINRNKKRASDSVASSKLEIRGPGTLIRQGSLFNSFMPSEKITKSEEFVYLWCIIQRLPSHSWHCQQLFDQGWKIFRTVARFRYDAGGRGKAHSYAWIHLQSFKSKDEVNYYYSAGYERNLLWTYIAAWIQSP